MTRPLLLLHHSRHRHCFSIAHFLQSVLFPFLSLPPSHSSSSPLPSLLPPPADPPSRAEARGWADSRREKEEKATLARKAEEAKEAGDKRKATGLKPFEPKVQPSATATAAESPVSSKKGKGKK